MARISFITPSFAVAPQLAAEDLPELERLGFRAIISNRPDSEAGVELTARKAATLAWRHGIRFRHVPAQMDEVLDEDVVDGFAAALAEVEGPVLAYCKSGTRAAILWALVAARQQPVACVLAALADAGYDLSFLEADLEAEAARVRPSQQARPSADIIALDCSGRASEPAPASAAA